MKPSLGNIAAKILAAIALLLLVICAGTRLYYAELVEEKEYTATILIKSISIGSGRWGTGTPTLGVRFEKTGHLYDANVSLALYSELNVGDKIGVTTTLGQITNRDGPRLVSFTALFFSSIFFLIAGIAYITSRVLPKY